MSDVPFTWIDGLISLSSTLNSVASEGSDSFVSSLPTTISPSSFSDYLKLFKSQPPLGSNALADVIWEVAGPAIAHALCDCDFRLGRRHALHFRSTPLEKLELIKTISPPSYTSEWLSGSALLLNLSSMLTPLSQHNLAQETLAMTTTSGGSILKVSGSAVTSILMMADALEAMLGDIATSMKRPKRLASIVENSIIHTFQTLFPLDYLESDAESSASGFGVGGAQGVSK